MSPRAGAPTARSAELRLVGLHVRGGSYALARAELEALAGVDRLDADGILDLAEVRWRTGDLAGAAAAAAAWLAEAPAESAEPAAGVALANAICAEAAAERGDPDAAAVFIAAAGGGIADGPALATLLAGIPPQAAWPWPAAALAPQPDDAEEGRVPAGEAPIGGEAAAAGPGSRPRGIPLAATAADLVASGASLVGVAPERAAVLLALALRADRAAAEAVLAALDAAGPSAAPNAAASAGPEAGAEPAAAVGPAAGTGLAALAFVRAEALRAAGRNDEARIAYASAERLALAPAEAGPPGSPQ